MLLHPVVWVGCVMVVGLKVRSDFKELFDGGLIVLILRYGL